ncbi:hypothetical protein DHEL01_v210689 [Diaporthe helianthi]|uniref:Uncharacterized protein n=1 Tax=Diaporthe helianthi TaxID=158607 RepID=A0A2P5HKY4_DIAHE|nr:hypothetical protein DHEL01_v210689 [Diaporthe helianthi]
MAQKTHWTERSAARQAFLVNPGLYKGKWQFQMFPYGPEPSDFDRYGQYFWFYGSWYIIWLSIIAAAVLIILDLILYVHPDPEPGRPDVKCLVLSVVPAAAVLVWMSIDGLLRKKTWPRGRLGVEGVVVIGTIVCLGLLGAFAGLKSSQGDPYAHWYAGLSGVLGALLLLRLLRLCELYYALRHSE